MRLRPRAVIVLAALGLAAVAAAAAAPPPLLEFTGFERRHISPNGDGRADSLVWFYTLSQDTATVTVLVRADSAGTVGPIVEVLLNERLGPLTDTLAWDGLDDQGEPFPEGRYWIDARAWNAFGSYTLPADSFIVDLTAPRDSILVPARTIVAAPVRRIEGWATDDVAIHLVTVAVFSDGGTLPPLVVCAPCSVDTATFAVNVPDPIALADTVYVVSELFDRALNRLVRTRAFVLDTLPPPAPTFDPPPATVDQPFVALSGSAPEADSVIVRRDGVHLARIRVINGRFSLTAALPSLGEHRFDALAIDRAGNVSAASAEVRVTYVEPLGVDAPERFVAGDRIQVNLPSAATRVGVRVLSLTGRLVRTFESTNGGPNLEFTWDLLDDDGRQAGSGPYVILVRATLADGSTFERRVAVVATR